mmetsp:Transcript_19326/g.55405  ORF Transcript_19326/g.55405 Transcript_19326/m.55405 type:complete len:206 (+) Transcript_19326:1-618(+)
MRFSIMQAMSANEVAWLSLDNVWRANQLFYMIGPIQLYSVYTGFKAYVNYVFYAQDVGGWSGGDLTEMSIALAKYWTTIIILMAITCWIYLIVSNPTSDEFSSRLPGCITLTMIAMDVLHPCVYLWTLGKQFSSAELKKMSCLQKLTSRIWWKTLLATIILNETLTNMFKLVAPLYTLGLPFLVYFNAVFGVNGGFMLVSVGAGH